MFREGAIPAFRELFIGAAPKFLSPVSPPYEDHQQLELWVADPPVDALARQVDIFIANITPQLSVLTMRSFLKLYTSIDASKLANFLDEDEDTVLEKMMSLKSASRSYTHKYGEGALLDGERIAINNLDFSIDGVSRDGGWRFRYGSQADSSICPLIVHGTDRRDRDEQTLRRLLYPQLRARPARLRKHQAGSPSHLPIFRSDRRHDRNSRFHWEQEPAAEKHRRSRGEGRSRCWRESRWIRWREPRSKVGRECMGTIDDR